MLARHGSFEDPKRARTAAAGLALLLALGPRVQAEPVGTTFTYQGRLAVAGAAANGNYDFEFRLFDAETGGNPVGPAVALSPVAVAGGLFTAALDFGAGAFDGSRRWLEIRAQPTGGAGFVTLAPRQEVTAAPNALWSGRAADAQALGGVPPSGYMAAGAIVPVSQGGTGATDAAGARTNLQAARSGANTDITSLSGLTTPLAVARGGTGATTATSALSALNAQARITGTCGPGQYVRSVGSTGTVVCGTDADTNSGGTVTSVATGAGLTGGPITTTGTVAIAPGGVTSSMIANGAVGAAQIDTSQVQARLSANCGVGQYLRGVNANGTVQCDSAYLAPAILTTVAASASGGSTSLAIGLDGLPVISFDASVSGSSLLKVVKCGNATCSAGNVITSVDDPANSVGQYSSLALGPDGFPVISYYDQTAGALKVAKCVNPACTGTSTITTVDHPANAVGPYTSLAIGQDGFPAISYYDQTAGALKVAKCGNAACSAGNVITTVDDTANDVGRFSSIAIGADGFPVISYEDVTGHAVKVAKCGNAACTGGATTTVVDSNPPLYQVGEFTSIALGQDGYPVLTYWWSTGNSLELRVAKCLNAACTGASALTTLDNGYTDDMSIAIGQNGFPVLSYDLGGALKVAKCGTVGCTGTTDKTEVDHAPTCGVFGRTTIALGQDGFPVISYMCAGSLKVAKCNTSSCGPY